jgi:hypothetical protein
MCPSNSNDDLAYGEFHPSDEQYDLYRLEDLRENIKGVYSTTTPASLSLITYASSNITLLQTKSLLLSKTYQTMCEKKN